MSNTHYCHRCNEGTEKLYKVQGAIGRYANQCCVCANSSRQAQNKANALIKNIKTRQEALTTEPALCMMVQTNILQ